MADPQALDRRLLAARAPWLPGMRSTGGHIFYADDDPYWARDVDGFPCAAAGPTRAEAIIQAAERMEADNV